MARLPDSACRRASRHGLLVVALLCVLAAALPWHAAAAPGGFITTVQVVGGLLDPIGVTHAGDGSGRLFVNERHGRIRIWTGSALLATPFLDISSLTGCPIPPAGDCGERGLLGLAFHPDYESNGLFYVFYTRAGDGALVLSRFQVSGNPNVANATGTPLLTIPHPVHGNHNGGHLAFRDGLLYVATGDGGGGDDPDENGQDVDALLGKILRLDVDGDDFPGDSSRNYAIPDFPNDNPFEGGTPGADEVWDYGLRNPWRFSFDRLTGDLFIGDVGQNVWEEIDFEPASSAGGINYGWDCREGAHVLTDSNGDMNASCGPASGMVDPVLEYSHSLGCSVTGGFVFRNLPAHDFYGRYFYGDFCSGRIWRETQRSPTWASVQQLDTSFGISSFGEDEAGRIYFTDLFGDTLQWLAPYSFADVPPTGFAWRFIEAIRAFGVTAGCGGDNYCPNNAVTRAEMAVFLLISKEGPGYTPPPCTSQVFADVPCSHPFAPWINELAARGVTAGCGGGSYCPGSTVTRAEMAVFLVKTFEGPSYVPPPCTTPQFADVPCSTPFAPWIHELANRGVTSGCGGGNFCPGAAVNRAQMAVFLSLNFGIQAP